MNKKRCSDCDKYERENHNFCRMCGFEFKPGFVKLVRQAKAYYTNEKICGYCGKQRMECKC